jgi:AraC family transcriptional regulator
MPMRERTAQSYHERVLRALCYIQNHLDDAIALEDLARVAHFSPFHFHRVFRGMVGESVMEHVRRLRLERAAHGLRFTDSPVTRLAFEAGYEAHEAFTRAFRAQFGESPSRFREGRRSAPLRAASSGVHYHPDGRLEAFIAPAGGSLEVRAVAFGQMRVAFLRHTGPYEQVGRAWQRLMAWAGPRGLVGPGATLLGVVHDDPEVTPADRVRYDACLVIGASLRPEGEVGVQELGGGEYAVVRHRGPYGRLAETYAQLCGGWLPAVGREPAPAPPFEVYRNSPFDTKPEDLVTDIHLPLEPAGAR